MSQQWKQAVMKTDVFPEQLHHLGMSCMRVPCFQVIDDLYLSVLCSVLLDLQMLLMLLHVQVFCAVLPEKRLLFA